MKGYCCENDKLYDVICQTPELLCVIARFGIGCGYCFLRHGVLCFLFCCFSCEGDIVFYVFTLCGVVRFCVPAGLL